MRETKRISIGRCDLSYYLYELFRRNFVVTKTRIIREWTHATIIITTVIGRIRTLYTAWIGGKFVAISFRTHHHEAGGRGAKCPIVDG